MVKKALVWFVLIVERNNLFYYELQEINQQSLIRFEG